MRHGRRSKRRRFVETAIGLSVVAAALNSLRQAAIVRALLPVLFWIRRTLAYQAMLWAGGCLHRSAANGSAR